MQHLSGLQKRTILYIIISDIATAVVNMDSKPWEHA